MGVALHSYKIDPDGEIRIRHTFYAPTETEALELKELHADACPAYGPAVKAGRTVDVLVEDVDPPTEEDAEDYTGDVPSDEDDDDA